MLCAAAGMAAAEANEKVQANAIRALGHLLASSHSDAQSITAHDQMPLNVPGPSPASDAIEGGTESSAYETTSASAMSEGSNQPNCGGSGADVSLQQRTSSADSSEAKATDDIGPAREHLLAWVEPGLRCLIRALQSGSVKVQWNACYAVGALLRCRPAAAAAQRAGLLGQLLQQLLQTLKHSSNFKASTSLAEGQDGTLHAADLAPCRTWSRSVFVLPWHRRGHKTSS